MLWIIKMLLQTPKAVYIFRRDYYRHKQIRKVIKSQGLVAGFYKHDELFGCDIDEWMVLCEYLTQNDKEIPQHLIDFALEREWITYKPDYKQEMSADSCGDTSNNTGKTWEEWENE